ncbi:hypothetical protein [Butyrivibrio sp. AE2005]|uniref:hypothetical protein n=1 Tax=Butyrivibrio sp. AE2005 TaxID=1496722 RepID=UPI00047C7792|nr:hypothetical protein [Butyrivibrio sp. AE2005]
MSNKNKMQAGVGLKGTFLGIDTDFYMDSNRDAACLIKLNNESLEKFLNLFDENTKNFLEPYVGKLGEFNSSVLVWYEAAGGLEVLLKDNNLLFLLYIGKQGRLLMFDYSINPVQELNGTDNDLFKSVMKFFRVDKLFFCYLQGSPKSERLKKFLEAKSLTIPNYRSSNAHDKFILYACIPIGDGIAEEENAVNKALKGIFHVNKLDLFVELSQTGARFFLMLPEITTGSFRSKNLSIEISLDRSIGLMFTMSGEFSFPDLNNAGFIMSASFGVANINFSASSLLGQVYQIPGTPVILSDMAISFGLSGPAIAVGIAAGVTIRQLTLFGAVHMTIVTEAPVVDLLAVAMTELSLPSICKNILGIDNDAVNMLDDISIMPFKLNYEKKLIPSKDTTPEQVAGFINDAIRGVFPFEVDANGIGLYGEQDDWKSLRVLDKNRMLHYRISETGELAFLPQFYYSTRKIEMGAYKFPQGIFFCGEINFLEASFKVMFCALDGEGIIGFAQIKEIDCGIIKLTGSDRSTNFQNPVTTDTDTMLSALVNNDSSFPDSFKKKAIAYLSMCKDKYSFYLDGHLELFGIFGVDAQILYMDKQIAVHTKLLIEKVFSTTLDLAVDYSSFKSMRFGFKIIFDAEPLYEQLKDVQDCVKALVKELKQSFSRFDEQLKMAEANVRSLQNKINDLKRSIQESKDRIHRAKWYQFWICVEEGAKIIVYEGEIVALNVSMNIALGALELVRVAAKGVEWMGEEVLNAVNAVITGVMQAFFVRYLEFGIEVKPGQAEQKYELEIKGEAKLTVIGKDISGSFKVEVKDITSSVKELLQKALVALIKSAFPKMDTLTDIVNESSLIEDRKNSYEEDIEDAPYKNLILQYDGPESLPEMAELAQEGTGRLEDGMNMTNELIKKYIREMKEDRPEFENLLVSYKDTVAFGASLLGKTIDNIYEPVQNLASCLTDLVTDLKSDRPKKRIAANALELDDIVAALENYRKYTEPAMAETMQVRNRIETLAEAIEPDIRKNMQHDLNVENNATNVKTDGISTLNNRNYDRLYNNMEETVQRYFPPKKHCKFFQFGNELGFYKALNESRKESGCAYMDSEILKEKMMKMKNENGFAEGYIQRLYTD